MFGFFKKKKHEGVGEAEVRSVCVIFNLINHASLMAAVLYATVLEERTALDVHLVDVRDVFPDDADQYIWFEAGTMEEYRAYYVSQYSAAKVAPSSELMKRFDAIEKRSTYVTEDSRQDMLVDDTVIGKAFRELVDCEIISNSERVLFSKYAMLSIGWLHQSSEAHEIVAYSEALQWCYHRYSGKPMTIADFKQLSSVTEEKVEEYIRDQKNVNRSIAQRCKSAYVDGKFVYYLTATGSEIYGIIRRIRVTKNEFLHCSLGSNGIILYASSAVTSEDFIESFVGQGILNLIPKIVHR